MTAAGQTPALAVLSRIRAGRPTERPAYERCEMCGERIGDDAAHHSHVVDISSRRVVVYKSAHQVHVFRAVVGKPSTPTPLGNFFVEESIRLPAGDVGAPYALALSARSNVYQEFAGGPGQIAMHGLANVGGVLGSAASHGCIRLSTGAMSWLVARIGPGAPVTITR